MELNGKVALIAGGARIGQVVARSLAAKGCHIAMTWHRSQEAIQAAVSHVEQLGVRGLAVKADLREEVEARQLPERIVQAMGRLDILVNMASLYQATPWEMLMSEPWDENMAANVRSAYLLALASAPFMKRQGAGRIINFSDWLAISGRPRYTGYVPYYVSKRGVQGLTEALALELAPEVLVNAIAPGPILPPPNLTDQEYREVIKATPLGRWGGAEEIAKAVLFLIETEFVTGESLRVDGGRHLR